MITGVPETEPYLRQRTYSSSHKKVYVIIYAVAVVCLPYVRYAITVVRYDYCRSTSVSNYGIICLWRNIHELVRTLFDTSQAK